MPRAVGINHIALEVGSIDEALDFYGRLFDLELRGRIRGMAFVDMGDQFLALAERSERQPDRERHFGLVVDDRDAVRAGLEAAGAQIVRGRGLVFPDSWGKLVEVVKYDEIQFAKTDGVLRGMGLGGIGKTAAAPRKISAKGLS